MANRYDSPELVELGSAEEIVLGPDEKNPPDNAVATGDRWEDSVADRDE